MQFELDIIKVVPPGDGFGYYDGKAVFVPATSPGDRVRVFSLRENRHTISAALQDVLIPAQDRIEPPCPHYNKCGGCSLMHLDYKQQLALKRRMLIEVLGNHGIQWNPQVVPSPETTRFRHKTRLRCVDGQLGFSERQSNRIVDIPECQILTEEILSTLKRLGQLGRSNAEYQLLQSRKTGEVGVSILDGNQLVSLPGFEQSIEEDYGSGPLVLHSHGFAQSNPFITTAIIEDLQHHALNAGSICELFCGCGTFSLALAATTPQFIGYDISPLSIQTAQETLQRQNQGHVKFAAINLNKLKELPGADVIVADPPRKGFGQHLCRLIIRSKARKLLYVSCNPVSLARDVRELTGQGGFELVEMKGYDMYCHATHLEAMAVLVRQA